MRTAVLVRFSGTEASFRVERTADLTEWLKELGGDVTPKGDVRAPDDMRTLAVI